MLANMIFGSIALILIALISFGATQPNRQQIDNFAHLAEKMSDRQHAKYCERYGEMLQRQSKDLWPQIHTRCIEQMVRGETPLPSSFPKIDDQMRGKIIEIFDVCAPAVKNPCLQNQWVQTKKCIREQAFNTRLLNANVQQSLPKNVPSLSLALASAIFECTEKVVNQR
ncbi:hypothetical protein SSS_02505 [Sarcoptes scabiei]|uniref:Uncharacterized protein n=1 Tax=Sarcoptes scabiei TaxID=52283 RepID=A0A834VFT6_SARSC|nr:hypothetical protein SSS_02505 [Sarcoptes scabiei]